MKAKDLNSAIEVSSSGMISGMIKPNTKISTMAQKRRASLFGGYPHEGTKSQDTFPINNRLYPRLDEGKIRVMINMGIYPQSILDNDTQLKDFLLDRIADYHQALEIAEQQISDIAVEYPFIPEDFGFELTEHKLDQGPDAYSPPIYYKEGTKICIARIEDDLWLVNETKVRLPNAHIAFIVLRALGVITDEEFAGDTEFKVNEADLTEEDRALIKVQELQDQQIKMPVTLTLADGTKLEGTQTLDRPIGHAEREVLRVRLASARVSSDSVVVPGVAFWNDGEKIFVVPANWAYTPRLWGTAVDGPRFEMIITHQEYIDLVELAGGTCDHCGKPSYEKSDCQNEIHPK